MIYLIGAFTIINILFYFRLAVGWRRIPQVFRNESLIPFSVVIPVRNEEHTISHLLKHLDSQNYPRHNFEVIVVDDFSDDATVDRILDCKKDLDMTIRLVQLDDQNKKGKKHALTAGIEAAAHETILTTDADCWFGQDWIRSYNDAFDDTTMMVAGPVAIKGKGLFGRLQQIEFAGLMGFGAVTISKENPSMCSGANLGFRKEAFKEVGGYSDNLFTPSGDDEFLLHSIMSRYPNSTRFLKTEGAIVNTPAHQKLSSFINQRIRWTSKWKYNKNPRVRVSAVLFFLDYLIYYFAIAGALLGWLTLPQIAVIIGSRFLALLLFIDPINRFLKGKSSFWPLIMFQIIYPLHVLFMGMNSIFGSYTWKGREYR